MASNVRTWLMEQMEPSLPGYVFMPWDTGFTPSVPTVMFYRSQVVPAPEAPESGYLVNTVTLYVAVSTGLEGSDALDALDVALDDVTVALHGVHNAVMQSATYQVLNDTVPCFQVLVEVVSNIKPTTSEEDS